METDTHPTPHPVLDARSLGRPVHLLDRVAQRCALELDESLRQGLNRRYGTAFRVVGARMARESLAAPQARWVVAGLAEGRLALALDRRLVLRVLDCRYGAPLAPAAAQPTAQPVAQPEGGDAADSAAADVPALAAYEAVAAPAEPEAAADSPPAAPADPLERPLTRTEERLAHKLALGWIALLAQRLREGLAPAQTARDAAALPQPEWLGEAVEPVGTWTLSLCLEEPACGGQALSLRLALDEAWMDLLLERLKTRRPAAPAPAEATATPLSARLSLRLQARLLSRRLSLGELFDLRPGSVIPVSLQGTEVLIKNTPLFSATVAEHKGKLWLTAFHDIS